ncbi:transglutaminase [Halalkalibacter wakoensis JCM 9140]|uniref:Transglutaminase n=1 Tax=Halalkalibacter wakoensis JCM 9140 TaxID=1236970 RepID=W4Q423_9BACI|nr:transglutaminase family protein [Halalkalibacter wakoensis]GAE26114.1 transglutaminase [Halalkalibacter wakoensis JCM 9140]
MKYEVLQSTHYQYSMPIRQSINQSIFKPLSNDYQQVLSYDQVINPEAFCSEHRDYWNNDVATFYIWAPHHELLVKTKSMIELNHPVIDMNMTNETEIEMDSESFKQRFAEFLMKTDYTTLSDDQLASIKEELGSDTVDRYTFVKRLNTYIYEQYQYMPGSTNVKTTAAEAFSKKTGVCQDFTHVMLAICRSKGIPARYVSGYIYSGEDVAMRGDSVTHAWVEVFFPPYGWIGFDPTNNMLAQNQHICVATGRDYADISPLKGVHYGNAEQTLSVSISVKAIS